MSIVAAIPLVLLPVRSLVAYVAAATNAEGVHVTMFPRVLILLVSFLMGACAHSARPVQFTESVPATAAADVIAHTALGGAPWPEGDRQQGIVTTPWADTGDRFPDPDPENPSPIDRRTVVVRRYRIRVAPQGAATSVQIDLEAKRCEPGFEVAGDDIVGNCDVLSPIFPKLQRDLDGFGARMRSLVAKTPRE
jgi:hypothetical protein